MPLAGGVPRSRAVTERLGGETTAEALGCPRLRLAGLARFDVSTRVVMLIVLPGRLVGGLDVVPLGEILGGRGLRPPLVAAAGLR